MDDGGIALVSRACEIESLRVALRARQSRLITGAAGAGKTRLLREALAAAGQPAVVIDHWPGVLHGLLVALAQGLGCRSGRYPDLRKAPSASLKPLILGALRDEPRAIIAEEVREADPRTYRFFQQMYYIPGCCLIVSAPSRGELGHLRKLLWDPREEIALKPLTRTEAARSFDIAARRFALDSLDLADFRAKALAAARGNPGQIIIIFRLASCPEYRHGAHIHSLTLRIDALTTSMP